MIFHQTVLPVIGSSKNRFACEVSLTPLLHKTWSGGCARFHGRMILQCVLYVLICVSPAFSELEALAGWFLLDVHVIIVFLSYPFILIRPTLA